MQTVVRIQYPWRGRLITLKRVKVNCAYCDADLLRSSTRARRPCFCNEAEHLKYKYEHNLINPTANIKAAHRALAAIDWKRGMPNPNVAGENSPAKRPEVRAKIKAAKLANNWMRGRTGKLHPNYQGGKIWWRGKEWDDTKLQARQRDGFACTECGMTEAEHIERFAQPLHVHHIIAYRVSHDNSMQNLQTLCDPCHGRKKRDENVLIEQCREILTPTIT